MSDYKAMYTTLFNAITDAITALQEIQKQAEEFYLSAGDVEDTQMDGGQ